MAKAELKKHLDEEDEIVEEKFCTKAWRMVKLNCLYITKLLKI